MININMILFNIGIDWEHKFVSQFVRAEILSPPLTSFGTLKNLLNLSMSQFPYLYLL